MDLWPRRFYVYLGAGRTPHNEVKGWAKRYAPPVCALMPDMVPDPAVNALNQANFTDLSRMLLDNQIVRFFACFSEFSSGAHSNVAGVVSLGFR